MKSSVLIAGLLACSVTFAFAQSPAGDAKPIPLTLTPPKDAPPVVPATPGPYAVKIESDPGLLSHTVYRPADLGAFTGRKTLPIVSWGNGGCSDAGLAFQKFLSTIVSNGFLVVAAGAKDTPLPDYSKMPPGPIDQNHLPAAKTKDEDLIHAIDWAVAENERKGSVYYHHLDTHSIAVMGQSCGGLQAIAASADPRVKTSVIWNSGTFPDGAPQSGALSSAVKASLGKIHGPIAYINGGPADVAFPNSEDDVKRLTQVPVFFGWVSVGHGGTYQHPGGGRFAPVAVAWLQWRLQDDAKAGSLFKGKDCGLYKDPVWHVVRND